MRALIAADGKTLDSAIAKRFGKAQWYLIVDLETNRIEQKLPNLKPEDHHEVVSDAAKWGVAVIVTGNIGPRSYELISLHNLQVAHARDMSVRAALDRLRNRALKILDAPTVRKNVEEHELILRGRRAQFAKGGRTGRVKTTYSSTTPRGQHHLQQYGGRGH
jgi:predicted Fe-Mo cluster-binding NifX family protein